MIRRALVGVDANANQQLEIREVRTLTGDDGSFEFEVKASNNNPIILTGGIDSALEMPFQGQLIAPMPTSTTVQMITPLTTLLAFGAEKFTLSVLLNLPLDMDWNQSDPASHFELFRAGVQVKTLSTQLSNITKSPQFLVFKEIAGMNNFSVESLHSMASSLAQTAVGLEDSILMHESFRAIGQATTRTDVIALEMLALDSFQ